MTSSEFIVPAGAELAEEVSEHMREGKPGRASTAFVRGWRDAVPELPLRFSVILVRPEREVISALYKRLHADETVELYLQRSSESQVAVKLVEGDARIGDLPVEDARLLSEMEADVALYRPQVLEIRYSARGRFDHIAIELVRPEVRLCSSCGQPHTGANVNCDECRGKRRPKGEKSYEEAPVGFHDAIDAVTSAGDNNVDF